MLFAFSTFLVLVGKCESIVEPLQCFCNSILSPPGESKLSTMLPMCTYSNGLFGHLINTIPEYLSTKSVGITWNWYSSGLAIENFDMWSTF